MNVGGNGDNDDTYGKVDLSPQDIRILNKLKNDNFKERGLPGAVLGLGACWAALKRVPHWKPSLKAVSYLLAASFGNFVGMVSNFGNMRERLLDELPPDSQLRVILNRDPEVVKRNIEIARRGGKAADTPYIPPPTMNSPPATTSPPFDQYSNQAESFPPLNKAEPISDYVPEGNDDEMKKFSTYDDLRQKYRNDLTSPPPPPATNQPSNDYPADQIRSDPPPKPVRYNKYGDPIID